jgi:hypothetical protein
MRSESTLVSLRQVYAGDLKNGLKVIADLADLFSIWIAEQDRVSRGIVYAHSVDCRQDLLIHEGPFGIRKYPSVVWRKHSRESRRPLLRTHRVRSPLRPSEIHSLI